ncbi:MAG: hypothetical protein ACRDLU_09055, partial [Gaiellaceae bacterium]
MRIPAPSSLRAYAQAPCPAEPAAPKMARCRTEPTKTRAAPVPIKTRCRGHAGLDLFFIGIILAFGPDLVARIRPRWQRRRELSERVPGWEAHIENIDQLGLLLMLTPPPDEEIDPTISCEVRLPHGRMTSPRRTPPMRPGTAAGADGKWNEWYSIRLPDDFDRVYSGAL